MYKPPWVTTQSSSPPGAKIYWHSWTKWSSIIHFVEKILLFIWWLSATSHSQAAWHFPGHFKWPLGGAMVGETETTEALLVNGYNSGFEWQQRVDWIKRITEDSFIQWMRLRFNFISIEWAMNKKNKKRRRKSDRLVAEEICHGNYSLGSREPLLAVIEVDLLLPKAKVEHSSYL